VVVKIPPSPTPSTCSRGLCRSSSDGQVCSQAGGGRPGPDTAFRAVGVAGRAASGVRLACRRAYYVLESRRVTSEGIGGEAAIATVRQALTV